MNLKVEIDRGEKITKVTFGAGCFWGVESAFSKIEGVTSTSVGYIGGSLENPSYEEVCTDKSGHAEVVQVEFDPSKVIYENLLKVFWEIHDPTTLNRQGPDIGTQYRSVIFYHDEEQRIMAEDSKKRLRDSGKFKNKVVTEIVPVSTFYRAEEYHQKYFEKHQRDSCHIG